MISIISVGGNCLVLISIKKTDKNTMKTLVYSVYVDVIEVQAKFNTNAVHHQTNKNRGMI